MNVSLQIYTNWAAAQKTDDAVFQNKELGADLAASDFLSRIRADCGVKNDIDLPVNIREAIANAQVVSGKPLTARVIKQVSTAALAWERDVNRLGNRIMDRGLSAETKNIYLEALTTARTREQLDELEGEIFKPSPEKAERPKPKPYQFGAGELFPKLGDKGLCFKQSDGANTCFAMSVLNGCSLSKKLSQYLNEKYKDLSLGLQLHYPKGGVKPVHIDVQYETRQAGKLGAFENAVVNYMYAADSAYRNEMTDWNPDKGLPLGNAVTFGKAIGLVQNQPDVIISDQGKVSNVKGLDVSVESYEKVRDRIARQLQQGGVVTMNVKGNHYVAITGIEGDTVTVVDSKDLMTGTHDLKTFTGGVADDYSGSYTFSFLDLLDEDAADNILNEIKQTVTKEKVLDRLAEKEEEDLGMAKTVQKWRETINGIRNFDEAVESYLRFLAASSDGRQYVFGQLQKRDSEGALLDAFVEFVTG